MLNGKIYRGYGGNYIITNKWIFTHMKLRFSYVAFLKNILGNEKLEKLANNNK